MAANTSPIFILSALSSGDPQSFTTANPDVTGASGSFTTLVTGGAEGSQVTSIRVRNVTDTAAGTILYIFHNTGGTRRNVGHLVVPKGNDPAKGGEPWEGIWINPNTQFPLASGDSFDIAPRNGNTVYHGWAMGGDY